jgi:hypothetical protein
VPGAERDASCILNFGASSSPGSPPSALPRQCRRPTPGALPWMGGGQGVPAEREPRARCAQRAGVWDGTAELVGVGYDRCIQYCDAAMWGGPPASMPLGRCNTYCAQGSNICAAHQIPTRSRCRLAPGKQMLGAHLMPARHLRHDRARRKRLRHNAALLLAAPPPPPANAIANLDAPSMARSVNYMVDHICEPIPSEGSNLQMLPSARCGQNTAYCKSITSTNRSSVRVAADSGFPIRIAYSSHLDDRFLESGGA